MTNLGRTSNGIRGAVREHKLAVMLAATVLAFAGCTAFNPALLDVVGASQFTSIENAPGHVVIAFINNATVDERIVDFLESPDGGSLVLTPAQKRSLRPVMRVPVIVQFTDESFQYMEFFLGSRELVQPDFRDRVFLDLNEFDSSNAVVVCDVAHVEVIRERLEVFVPVGIDQYTFVRPILAQAGTYRFSDHQDPQFVFLREDFITMGGDVVRANIGARDVPAPVDDPLCGSVVTITVTGELSVPFFDPTVSGGNPSYTVANINEANSIGGRYEFQVSVR